MFEHDHAKTVWFTIEAASGDSLRHVMVVETDLATNSLVDGYDDTFLENLIHAAVAYVKAHKEIDSVRVIPIGPDASSQRRI
jgi:hypothetical protein